MADLDERLAGLDAAWPALEPRADFTERVVARLAATAPRAPTPRPPRRWLTPTLAALAGAAIACVVVLVVTRPRGDAPSMHPTAQGSLTADAHTTIALGDRGVIVAHAGAVLAWTVDATGAADINQLAGQAFYRVEPGGPLVVRTPTGEVHVTGTCFTVTVDEGVTTVDVDEGTVALTDAASRVELRAGDRGHVGGGGPARRRPAPRPADATTARNLPTPAAPATARTRADCFCFSDPRYLEADQALLDSWAGLCRVRADVPPVVDGLDTAALDAAADQLGLVGAERVAFHDAAVELTTLGLARVREIYVAATGDADGADDLDVDAQIEQIVQTGALGDDARLRAKLSQERAGHAPAPTDTRAMTPFEEFYRFAISAGDTFERLLAARLGAPRAHALRLRFGGWPGPDFDWFGCP